jgi:hypothetical protein
MAPELLNVISDDFVTPTYAMDVYAFGSTIFAVILPLCLPILA